MLSLSRQTERWTDGRNEDRRTTVRQYAPIFRYGGIKRREKKKNTGYQHFLLFPQYMCFQKDFPQGRENNGLFGKGLKRTQTSKKTKKGRVTR